MVKGRGTLWTTRIRSLKIGDQRLMICAIKIMKFTNEIEACGGNVGVIAIVVKFA
jgi:hypothetical protein